MDGLLNFLAIDDNDADVASLVIQLWLRRKSPLQVWFKEKRRTLQTHFEKHSNRYVEFHPTNAA
jgi:hypothetical protein